MLENISVSPATPPAASSPPVSPILITPSEASSLAGGGLKTYKIRELSQQENCAWAVRLPGEGGRGRRIYINRIKFLEWLEGQFGERKVG